MAPSLRESKITKTIFENNAFQLALTFEWQNPANQKNPVNVVIEGV